MRYRSTESLDQMLTLTAMSENSRFCFLPRLRLQASRTVINHCTNVQINNYKTETSASMNYVYLGVAGTPKFPAVCDSPTLSIHVPAFH